MAASTHQLCNQAAATAITTPTASQTTCVRVVMLAGIAIPGTYQRASGRPLVPPRPRRAGAPSAPRGHTAVMGRNDDAERVQPAELAAWRDWLETNHATARGVWLVTWKRASGREPLGYDAAVTEALAFGWVDSLGRALDDERTMLWFAPRKPTSAWSRPNKVRVALLEAQGRMAPAGARTIAVAKENGTWTVLDDVENLLVPPDLAAAFDARPGSRAHWDGFPRSVQRGVLEWIVLARRADTRARRITETADDAARGDRPHQWRRPTP